MIQGFILGLSSGGICLLYCLPVLFPFLMAEGERTRINYRYLAEFMAGRLAGYILFAAAAWATGKLILENAVIRETIFAAAYVVLSMSVAVYLLSHSHRACSVSYFGKIFSKLQIKRGRIAAPLIGFLTGINLCPPFLLAFTGAAGRGGLLESILYFVCFFAGTTVYFLPVPFIGIAGSKKLKTVGIMSGMLVAVYYLINGITMLAGVMKLYD